MKTYDVAVYKFAWIGETVKYEGIVKDWKPEWNGFVEVIKVEAQDAKKARRKAVALVRQRDKIEAKVQQEALAS